MSSLHDENQKFSLVEMDNTEFPLKREILSGSSINLILRREFIQPDNYLVERQPLLLLPKVRFGLLDYKYFCYGKFR